MIPAMGSREGQQQLVEPVNLPIYDFLRLLYISFYILVQLLFISIFLLQFLPLLLAFLDFAFQFFYFLNLFLNSELHFLAFFLQIFQFLCETFPFIFTLRKCMLQGLHSFFYCCNPLLYFIFILLLLL